MLILEKFIDDREVQDKNILFIVVTEEVSKFDKSIETIDEQELNILEQLLIIVFHVIVIEFGPSFSKLIFVIEPKSVVLSFKYT